MQCMRSMRVVSVNGDSACTTISAPRPPRWRPAPRAVLAQRILLDEHRILGFELLGRAVVRVAVVDADGRRHAILVRFRAPAAAERADADDEQLAVGRDDAVDVGEHEIGMVAGDRRGRESPSPAP